ncbi:MAG: radical SAM protein, partial [Deltaproteobacteria bacterium]|nr:radical SAM protein [Deltaproteobacteria bacterium]
MSKKIRFYIVTLGCPKNEVDSEIISSHLKREGYQEVLSPEKSDVILVNSCGFIKAAKEETLDTVFSFHRRRKIHQKILMLGCLAQRYKGEIEKILPEVDGFIGADAYNRIGEIVKNIVENSSVGKYWGNEKSVSMLYNSSGRNFLKSENSYTYIKIADGCSNRCSFCAIPIIKGKYRSRRIDDILEETENLIKSGCLEIGLVSQDLTAYGLDLGYKDGLTD